MGSIQTVLNCGTWKRILSVVRAEGQADRNATAELSGKMDIRISLMKDMVNKMDKVIDKEGKEKENQALTIGAAKEKHSIVEEAEECQQNFQPFNPEDVYKLWSAHLGVQRKN